MLMFLLHVSQQVWWLEATPSKTYPLEDTSSMGSRKYLSRPSKHQVEYAFYLNNPFMQVYMIMFKRNISANLSYISFYKSNDFIELWMTDMESPNPIRQKHAVSTYSKKQDQSTQRSYYSILKILFTITSFSLLINMISMIEEQRRTWTEKEEKRKAFFEKHRV